MSCFLPRPAESLISVIAVGRKYGAVTKVKKVTGKCYCPETPWVQVIEEFDKLDEISLLEISTVYIYLSRMHREEGKEQ
jgi:hypothetical protein